MLFYVIWIILIKKGGKLHSFNKKLELLSNTDQLTSLTNRYYFDKHLSEQWSLMKKLQKPISLIMCDIDYFKQYNDSFGHQTDGYYLIEIADSLKDVIKKDSDVIACYGGEEFAIPDINNKNAT